MSEMSILRPWHIPRGWRSFLDPAPLNSLKINVRTRYSDVSMALVNQEHHGLEVVVDLDGTGLSS